MSTIDRSAPAVSPPLVAGQRLDRVTFHERYERMPPNTRAELIGGVVHMPSPLSHDHGDINAPIVRWLVDYERATRGIRVTVNASTLLDELGETQPDVSLRILPDHGGQTRIEGKYLAGPPELVVEIARSSRSIDLGPKLQDYQRAGVREYLVIALEPDEVFWFARRDDLFTRLQPVGEGLYRSGIFPGLWLDAEALYRRDFDQLDAALARGLASPEHAEFVQRLARAGGRERSG